MKKLLIIIALPALLCACYGTDGGGTKQKSFNQQIKELEKEHSQKAITPQAVAGTTSIYQSEPDQLRDIEIAAQSERRAAAPMVESDYIFKVMPDKGTYSFDEYNQPTTDDPKLADYKDAKRLWKKPQRFAPEVYGTEEVTEEQATESEPAAQDYSGFGEEF